MPQVERGVNTVGVAPTRSGNGEVARLNEVANHGVRKSLGDAHGIADVAQARSGVSQQIDQHVGVIAEERPPGTRRVAHTRG